jgi:hypothetical protein
MTCLPDAIFGTAGLLAAQRGDGAGDGPAHAGEFEALAECAVRR